MKHFLLTLGLLLFTCSFAVSQTKNIDVDNLRFNVTYRLTPEKKTDPLFFYYATKINATKSTEQRVSIEEIENALSITGQRQTEDAGSTDMLLTLTFGDLIIKRSDVSERKEERKDRDGKVTGVSYYYKVIVTYVFDASYKLTKGEELLLQGTSFASRSPLSYSSSEYGSRKEATDYWNNNRDVLIAKFVNDLAMQTVRQANAGSSSRFGFPVVKTTDIIETMDEKKHLENNTFRNACTSLKAELESMTAEKGMNKEKVYEIIEYFKSIPDKYTDPKLKADVKIRYCAYYNICKAYLYLDEPEKVAEYANLLIKNGYDKKDGERFIKEANKLAGILNRTTVNTRHFNTDDYFSEEEN